MSNLPDIYLESELSTKEVYQDELNTFKKNVNFILDDILNSYYPCSTEELNLHKNIAETYNVASARRLYEIISGKTPYKRVWDIFVQFHHLLVDFITIINKIKAMDRICDTRRETLNEDLYSSFYQEYYAEIENCVNVAKNISTLAIFFEYFVPNNDRVLVKIFKQDNLKQLYINVNNITNSWNNIHSTDENDDVYLIILKLIRNIDCQKLSKIVQNWKHLQKRLKHYYPTSIIWYSKKHYFDLIHELINILEKYHKYKDLGDLENLAPEKKKKLRIRKPSFRFGRRKHFHIV